MRDYYILYNKIIMKIDILPFSTYKDISITNHVEQLIGTQCIYPLEFQSALINTFIGDTNYIDLRTDSNDTSDDIKYFCFKINDVYLYPKYTFEDPNVREPIIIVSDEFFERYFLKNSKNHIIHIIYDIPLVKMITLKRLSGDFPRDDSLEFLLTNYFESCSIVNLSQRFILNTYDNGALEFIVENITYKSEFENDIRERVKSIKLLIKFNTYLSEVYDLEKPIGMQDCESEIINYKWFYHTIGKKINTLGYLVNNEVEIDFLVTEKNHDDLPYIEHKEEHCDEGLHIEDPHEEGNHNEECYEISKDELLKRRLEFFKNIKN